MNEKDHLDDLDRELKLVQLQRERLALEREMAFQGAGNKVKQAAKAITQGITFPFKAIGQSFKNKWKVILTILTVGVGIAAGLQWKDGQERQARMAIYSESINAWNIGFDQFKSQECPETTYACSTSGEWTQKDPSIAQYICSRKASDRALCELGAMTEYTRRLPRPFFSND